MVSEALGAHVLQLPYKGDSISMFVFLPPYAAPRGITNILKRLTPQILREILTEEVMIPREVEVGIPKFSIEQSLELVPVSGTKLLSILLHSYTLFRSRFTGGRKLFLFLPCKTLL